MASPEKHYHAVQFYKDEASLAGTVAQFLADGLVIGQPGLVMSTPMHADSIVRELASRGVDVQAVRTTGELQFFDARKALLSFMVGDLPDPVLFRNRIGEVIEQLCGGRKPCPIRAYGEMVDLLWQDGNVEGAIKVEILWNRLGDKFSFALLCGYAMGNFYKQPKQLEDICALHTHVTGPDNVFPFDPTRIARSA